MTNRYVTLLTIATVAALLAWLVISREKVEITEALNPHDMRTWHHADTHLGHPIKLDDENWITPSFQTHFIRLSAFDIAALPVAKTTSFAIGGVDAAMSYNVQATGEQNSQRGGRHSGDDWNGIGGMNTDLGDPVFSIADGKVIFSAQGSPGWGNIVIVAHRLPDGRCVQSFYAHLEKRLVRADTLVSRGEKIGTIGTANRLYPAHLHLELRDMPTLNAEMRGYHKNSLPSLYLSPEKFITKNLGDKIHAPPASTVCNSMTTELKIQQPTPPPLSSE